MKRSALLSLALGVACLGLLLSACSDTRVPIGAPHPLGRALLDPSSSSFHGDSSFLSSLTCSECHDVEEKCSECHFGPDGSRVPPGVTWTHGTIPHHFPQFGDTCNACHSLERSFGDGPQSCHDCHGAPSAPHPLGAEWIVKSADFHGNNTTLNCQECHAPLSDFCTQCHFDTQGSRTPAGVVDWSHNDPRTGHAFKNVFTADEQSVCTKCHGLENQFTGQPTFTDCSSNACHPGLPDYHGQGFFGSHPAAAHSDLSTCAVCHNRPGEAPNFDGYVTGVACALCHTDALAHPPPPSTVNWYVDHRTAGGVRIETCGICHDVTQGRPRPLPQAPSCFSADFGGQSCHPNGPGSAPHAVPFIDPALHGPAAKAAPGFPYCQNCHADPPTGANPRFNVPVGILPNGCEACHAAQTAHPSTNAPDTKHWYGVFAHADAQNHAVSCAVCHGANLGGPADGGVGPACVTCHKLGSPLTLTNCASCHASPPNGDAGAAFPNRPGAHATHNALAVVTGNCNTCHNGAGYRTAKHFDGAVDAAFPSSYNAKTGGPALATITSGAAGPTAATCAGVSCHGAQTTPDWLAGNIDVTTQCTSCHRLRSVSDQYNSYFSGQHSFHVQLLALACTGCHNTSALAAATHFAHLDDPSQALAGAAGTLAGGNTLLTSYTPGATAGTGSCSPKPGASVNNIACHGTRSWSE